MKKQNKSIKSWWNGLADYNKFYIIFWGGGSVLTAGLLALLVAMGVVPTECGVKEETDHVPTKKVEFVNDDNTKIMLPGRQNTGDTVYVLARDYAKGKVLRVVDKTGNVSDKAFVGANYVNPGDTIVVDSKRNFLMKNITQNNVLKKMQKHK